MADPKPLASLSAGLLARKGAARPAMRRQAQLPGSNGFTGQEDLGWNDMGYDVDPANPAAEIGRVASQGLSPMASSPADSGNPLDALDAAVERVMPSPVIGHASAGTGGAAVKPIDASHYVPAQAPAPAVHEQQQRIEDALIPLDATPERVAEVAVEQPSPANEPVAQPAAIIASPIASPTIASPTIAPPAIAAPALTPPAITVPAVSARKRARAGTKGNFAFTLRLDPNRHLRLRIASATSNRSVQQIMIALVDDYLSDLPEIDAFAAQVPASNSAR